MDELTQRGMTACFGYANFTALTGAATTVTTGNTIDFSISGKFYTKANGALTTPTTDGNDGTAMTLTANKARAIVWGLDSGGNPKAYAGAIVDWDGTAFQVTPPFPSIPDSVCPIGYSILKAGSTLVGTFTVGSSNWNTTGMTNTIVSCATLPERPQTA